MPLNSRRRRRPANRTTSNAKGTTYGSENLRHVTGSSVAQSDLQCPVKRDHDSPRSSTSHPHSKSPQLRLFISANVTLCYALTESIAVVVTLARLAFVLPLANYRAKRSVRYVDRTRNTGAPLVSRIDDCCIATVHECPGVTTR